MGMASEHRARPRQDPVSCESCRKKKLKCDREFPCANCTSRGVDCQYQGRRAPIATTTPIESEDLQTLKRENAAIKARINNLEEIIYSGAASSSHVDERPSKARRIANEDRENPLISPSTTAVSDSPTLDVTRDYCKDVQWLEGVGCQENTRLPQLSAPYAVKICLMQYIIDKATNEDHRDRCIWIPCKQDGLKIFDPYAENLDPLQHLIHVPTARQSVKQLYQKLRLGQNVQPNETLLLLAALASTTSYWGLSDSTTSMFDDKQTTINVAVFFLRTALDLLEHVRRSASACLETVQASIILIFLIYHIEGFSPKVRALAYATLAVAKDLGMHRTDDPSLYSVEESQLDIVDREVRRRVWWHLAATDWSLSLSGGPHEGTYNVNPKHMRVNRPRNISDEDLSTQPADFDRPLSEPTIMGYYLQRIRLAEICRHVADMSWEREADQVDEACMRQIDREFDALVADLPEFLRMDMQSKFAELDKQEPKIMMQRYIVNLTVHAKRCKFHLPFLLRAAHDSKFAFSRNACLRAARSVLETWEALSERDGNLWIASSRLCGMLHLFFYATMVLVMDYCVNRNVGCDLGRKTEIQKACQILADAKQECGAAGMFLDSLYAVLRKHRVRLQNAEQVSDYLNSSGNPKAAEANALAPGWNIPVESVVGSNTVNAFESSDLDELWKSFIDLEASMDPQSWSALLNDVDTMYRGSGCDG